MQGLKIFEELHVLTEACLHTSIERQTKQTKTQIHLPEKGCIINKKLVNARVLYSQSQMHAQ